jgi:ribosomal protein S18 acetylase RimI-like enzyme
LGYEAVRRYYEYQLTGPHQAIALGIEYRNRLAGFCFAGVFRGSLTGFVRKNKAFLTWRLISHPWLLTNTIVRDRLQLGLNILARFSRRQPSSSTLPPNPAKRYFGILAIAVHPHYQGMGLGKALMDKSEAIATSGGFQVMRLSVNTHNQQAIHFYERLGWRKIPEGKNWAGHMEKTLSLQG